MLVTIPATLLTTAGNLAITLGVEDVRPLGFADQRLARALNDMVETGLNKCTSAVFVRALAEYELGLEIVRRRLFETITDTNAFTQRDLVVRAFTDHYAKHSILCTLTIASVFFGTSKIETDHWILHTICRFHTLSNGIRVGDGEL